MHALRLTGPVKIHGPVHDPVVRDGYGGLAQLLHPPGQLLDAAGSVQKGELCVQVQMDKGHNYSSR